MLSIDITILGIRIFILAVIFIFYLQKEYDDHLISLYMISYEFRTIFMIRSNIYTYMYMQVKGYTCIVIAFEYITLKN